MLTFCPNEQNLKCKLRKLFEKRNKRLNNMFYSAGFLMIYNEKLKLKGEGGGGIDRLTHK